MSFVGKKIKLLHSTQGHQIISLLFTFLQINSMKKSTPFKHSLESNVWCIQKFPFYINIVDTSI